MRQARSPVSSWRRILIKTYDELIRIGASDVWVFGSQAMGLYMRALASKDLDLIVTGLSMSMVNELRKSLAPFSGGAPPSFEYSSPIHDGRNNPLFSIFLNPPSERPFVIELFETYSGYEVTRLTPYVANITRWRQTFQTLSIEAIIGTRLAFRPPDRITAFNADRLNRFIRAVRERIDWNRVDTFVRDFQLGERIRENLDDLRRRNKRILDSEQSQLLSQNLDLPT